VEHLLCSLELNPQIIAATGKIIFPDGTLHLFGADYHIKDDVLFSDLQGSGKHFDHAEAPGSGICKWVSGTSTMFRRSALLKKGLDARLSAYYEDLEFCFRVNKAGSGRFYRNADSMVIHYHQSALPDRSLSQSERRRQSMKYIETIAQFYQIHGNIIGNLFDFVPDLGSPESRPSVSAAKLFLDLINAHGQEWVLERWNQNELDSLFPTPTPPKKRALLRVARLLTSLSYAKQKGRRLSKALVLRWSRLHEK
jgi:hypothetical protein